MKANATPRTVKPSRKNGAASFKDDAAWSGSVHIAQEPRALSPIHLTAREREVLALLCEGLPNKLIARHLKISAGTVKVHISNIFRALNVSNRLQAVLIARCWELTRAPDAAAENASDGAK